MSLKKDPKKELSKFFEIPTVQKLEKILTNSEWKVLKNLQFHFYFLFNFRIWKAEEILLPMMKLRIVLRFCPHGR